jgi:hypothetical protein
LVSGVIASMKWGEIKGVPTTLRGSAKAFGFAAALVVANLVGDCAVGLLFGRDESLLSACTSHWPFLVTAFCFVPILGATIVELVRVSVQEVLGREG